MCGVDAQYVEPPPQDGRGHSSFVDRQTTSTHHRAVTCQGHAVVAVIDQVRAVAKHRLKSKIEAMTHSNLVAISRAISTILEIR